MMTGDHRLSASIESWSGVRILCVGDVMLDRFIYGAARRISPEAPIPVLLIDHEEAMLGGAGNVVRNLAALGALVSFVSVTGADADGDTIEALLNALPACASHVVRDPARRTSVKTRYLAHSQQLLRVDAENTAAVGEEVIAKVLKGFEAALAAADLVVLSDYAKGVLTGSHTSRFIDLSRAAHKPVFVDPKGSEFSRYRGATLIKPNLKELAEATRMPVDDDAAVEAAARRMREETGIPTVLVTRGAAGMMLVREGAPTQSFRSMAREIYDVSGAGDTVAAALAMGAASGLDLADAVRIACIAAGIVVGKIGTATVTSAELLREYDGASADTRIWSESEAQHRAEAWRAMGLRVSFIEGNFDTLDARHIAQLQAAKADCDKLIVRVTGKEESRIVISALSCVDLVVAA
jgi:D-beta-D-heptose 7-phosphate kinase/D-beta-D-heptose 1-phosphate adenosyltransferase